MSPKSVWKIVEYIKGGCEKYGDPQIDEASLYRHVEEMLDLEREPPESAPAEIVDERYVENIRAATGLVTEKEVRTAADWAWVIFATSLESIHQPVTTMATTLSSIGCLLYDGPTSSSGCRPYPDPRSLISGVTTQQEG
jgi:hypothetical protein